MGLMIRFKADGSHYPNWYGRITIGDKVEVKRLETPVLGSLPLDDSGMFSLRARGDDAFERSRSMAWRELSATKLTKIDAFNRKDNPVTSMEIPFSRLIASWQSNHQNRSYCWAQATLKWLRDFIAFCADYATQRGIKPLTGIHETTKAIADAWYDSIKSKYTIETITKITRLLSTAFREQTRSGVQNPFEELLRRKNAHRMATTEGNIAIPKEPLTRAEVEELLNLCHDDDYVFPIATLCARTGLRIGDVACLKWESIHLDKGLAGFIDLTTSKKQIRAQIDIYNHLHDHGTDVRSVLDKAFADRVATPESERSDFLFPRQAADYLMRQKLDADGRAATRADGTPIMTNRRDRLYKTIQPYLVQIIMKRDGDKTDAAETIPHVDLATALAQSEYGEQRRKQILTIYSLLKSGAKQSEIQSLLGISKAMVSGYLKIAEQLTGEVLRIRSHGTKRDAAKVLQQTRAVGKRSACVYGYHSLRHSFALHAIEDGMPPEIRNSIMGYAPGSHTAEAGYSNSTMATAEERSEIAIAQDASSLDDISQAQERLAAVISIIGPKRFADFQTKAKSRSINIFSSPVKALELLQFFLEPGEVDARLLTCDQQNG